MVRRGLFLSLAMFALSLVGCAKPEGTTVADKRSSVLQLQEKTLTELYQSKPATRQEIASSAGYGVFSNININLFLLSSGNGYGIIHDNASNKDTYMKMRMLGGGLGAGVKDFRAVIVFKNKEALTKFVESGWEWGGHADAAAKADQSGGEVSAAGEVTGDMKIYNFTETGIALQATIAGTKYWKDEELNRN